MTPIIRAMFDPLPDFVFKIGVTGGGVPGGVGGVTPGPGGGGGGGPGATLSVTDDTLNYMNDPSDLPVT